MPCARSAVRPWHLCWRKKPAVCSTYTPIQAHSSQHPAQSVNKRAHAGAGGVISPGLALHECRPSAVTLSGTLLHLRGTAAFLGCNSLQWTHASQSCSSDHWRSISWQAACAWRPAAGQLNVVSCTDVIAWTQLLRGTWPAGYRYLSYQQRNNRHHAFSLLQAPSFAISGDFHQHDRATAPVWACPICHIPALCCC